MYLCIQIPVYLCLCVLCTVVWLKDIFMDVELLSQKEWLFDICTAMYETGNSWEPTV